MPVLKVYISSTYVDLKDHRKEVRAFFGKFRDKFEIISMEDYVAESELPAEKCIEDVKKCNFYILILANRYGFIPKSTEKLSNPDMLSVTNLEYQAAKDNDKKVFAFFADEKGDFETDKGPDEEIIKLKKQKLSVFKEDVRNRFLTHPEGFNSPHQLALMVAESMMKAGERYGDLLTDGEREKTFERHISRDRIYCLNRSKQYHEFLNTRINTSSPFKVIITHGPKDMLVESFQKRITDLTLNIPKTKIFKNSLNGIFGSSADYESSKLVFLNAAFQQLFSSTAGPVELKTVSDFVVFINNQQDDLRVAFIIQWSNLIDGEKDPRIPPLKQLMAEFSTACIAAGCRKILFFINIEYKPESEVLFSTVIREISSQNPAGAPYVFPLEKLSKVMCEDLEIWIENYVTEIPYKVNKIISDYLPDLDDEFSMQAAQEKMDDFIMKVNNQDKDVIELLK